MKRIARLLTRIYPAAWRERYGEELDGLIEDRGLRAADLFDVFWTGIKMRLTGRSLVRVVLPCAMAGGLAGVVIAIRTPVLYSSQTIAVMTTFNVPDNDDASPGKQAAVGPDDREAKALLTPLLYDLLSPENLRSIILRYDLYPNERKQMPMDGVIDKMRKAILVMLVPRTALENEISHVEQARGIAGSLEREKQYIAMEGDKKYASGALAMRFRYPDPHVAQKVDAELIGLLVRENLIIQWQASHSRAVLEVLDAASLPQRPDWPSRAAKSAIGLLAGLACGLLLAMTGIGNGLKLAER